MAHLTSVVDGPSKADAAKVFLLVVQVQDHAKYLQATVEVEEGHMNLGPLVKTDEVDPIVQRTSDWEARSNDAQVLEVEYTAQASQPQTQEGSLVVVTQEFELEAAKVAPTGSMALDIAKVVTYIEKTKQTVEPVADVGLPEVDLYKTAKVALQAFVPVQVDQVALHKQALVAPAGFQESMQEEVGLLVSLVTSHNFPQETTAVVSELLPRAPRVVVDCSVAFFPLEILRSEIQALLSHFTSAWEQVNLAWQLQLVQRFQLVSQVHLLVL